MYFMRRKYKQITTKEWRAWQAMKTRCNNPNTKLYHRYGGRGITYCHEFESFKGFLENVGYAPSPKHSLDRIENNGNYEIGNVRWATASEQAYNKEPFLHKIVYSESVFLSRHEAMKYLGFKIKWMEAAEYRNLVPHIKIGRYTRYNLEELKKFKEEFIQVVGLCPSQYHRLTRIDKEKDIKLHNIEWRTHSDICYKRKFTHSCVDLIRQDVELFPVDTGKNRSKRLNVSESTVHFHLNRINSYKKIHNITDKLLNLFKIWPKDMKEVTYKFLVSNGYKSGQIAKYVKKGVLIRISKGRYKMVEELYAPVKIEEV